MKRLFRERLDAYWPSCPGGTKQTGRGVNVFRCLAEVAPQSEKIHCPCGSPRDGREITARPKEGQGRFPTKSEVRRRSAEYSENLASERFIPHSEVRIPTFTLWLVIAPPSPPAPTPGAPATGHRTPLCSGYTNSRNPFVRNPRRQRSGNRTSWVVVLAEAVEKSLLRQVYARMRGERATRVKSVGVAFGQRWGAESPKKCDPGGDFAPASRAGIRPLSRL